MARGSKYEGGSKSKSFRLPSKFFEKAVKEVEGLLSKYEKKPMSLVFPQITGGISFGAKTYYDINMANIPSEKTMELFLAATASPDFLWKIPSQEEHNKLREEALPYVNAIMEEMNVVDPDFMDKVLKSLKRTRPIIGMAEGEPEKRIPGTLNFKSDLEDVFLDESKKKILSKMVSPETMEKLKVLDPNIIIPGDKK